MNKSKKTKKGLVISKILENENVSELKKKKLKDR
jgi:hypothetical protein